MGFWVWFAFRYMVEISSNKITQLFKFCNFWKLFFKIIFLEIYVIRRETLEGLSGTFLWFYHRTTRI